MPWPVTVFQELLCHLSVTHPICKGLLFLKERLKELNGRRAALQRSYLCVTAVCEIPDLVPIS